METFTETRNDYLPISYLAEYFFCERSSFYLFAQAESNGLSDSNYVKSKLLHESTDSYSTRYRRGSYSSKGQMVYSILPIYPDLEYTKSTKQVTGLPLKSNIHGLFGKADLVEFQNSVVIPVEFKKKINLDYKNLKAQLILQSLCLEEMFKTNISKGFLFSFTDKRRREVFFTQNDKLQMINELQTIRAKLKTFNCKDFKQIKNNACKKCIFVETCLPKVF